MIIIYQNNKTYDYAQINETNKDLLKEAIWIDLINPTVEEEALVEQCFALNVPTREEMREIEISSRLYKTDYALFMTAIMIAQSDTLSPELDAVTFVLTKHQLITIRYIEPKVFKIFTERTKKIANIDHDPALLLIDLLDLTVDRLADILEKVSHELENYSRSIFNTRGKPTKNYHNRLQELGLNGELNSKIVESLLTFSRLISFFEKSITDNGMLQHHNYSYLQSLAKDIIALNDHAAFLSTKINFLLDATLGMINNEQNSIIKIFSVAAVIFLPPTLIASIYGMNFHFIPELSWKYGYLFAIGTMLLSSWLPYKYFKYRKWL